MYKFKKKTYVEWVEWWGVYEVASKYWILVLSNYSDNTRVLLAGFDIKKKSFLLVLTEKHEKFVAKTWSYMGSPANYQSTVPEIYTSFQSHHQLTSSYISNSWFSKSNQTN